ncbi:hypothetical protein [Vibrio harveyi]|uniref:hypothetical protein n=1 Tax=Vibrio harveyi TaxID=669 RepID=UPI0018F1FFC9|nr:hypothetical protein [Vibrio harveyi]HDM8152845.1 hypothetical protein [Vibrio harveyi]
MDWFNNLPKEDVMWIFSGIGTTAVAIIIGLFINKSNKVSMSQKSGKNSRNYQAKGNIEIGKRDD